MANNSFLIWLQVFMLVFCSLNVIRCSFNLIKTLYTQSGKIENDTWSRIFFGASLSYLITTIMVGFF